jgi:hypothetical protein
VNLATSRLFATSVQRRGADTVAPRTGRTLYGATVSLPLPRFTDARYNLATSYEQLGDEALAIQHLREYRELVEGDRAVGAQRRPEPTRSIWS